MPSKFKNLSPEQLQNLLERKDVFTIGEVSSICSVSPRTVSKWFDTGLIDGYRIPGSRDRRIPITCLLSFLDKYNLPVEAVMRFYAYRVLFLFCDSDQWFEQVREETERLDRVTLLDAYDPFNAGMIVERERPHMVIMDKTIDMSSLLTITVSLPAYVRPCALVNEDTDASELEALGVRILRRPFTKPLDIISLIMEYRNS